MTEQYTYVPTKLLQLESLYSFARVLGYHKDILSNSFHYEGDLRDITFKGCETISLSTFVKLHNTQWWVDEARNLTIPIQACVVQDKLFEKVYTSAFMLDPYTLNKAYAAKIVESVYLHPAKNGTVNCYKQQIKFVHPLYENMFLKPLIDEYSKGEDK